MLLSLLACIENELGTDEKDPVPFDSGTTPVEDTATDSGTTPTDPSCVDQVFPGYAGSVDGDCAGGTAVGTFTPEIEWEWTAFADVPSFDSVMMQPIVVSLTDDDGDGDADADDVPDVAFVAYEGTNWTGEGVIRAVSGDGSAEVLTVSGEDIEACSGLAAADLDGDGWVELVAFTTDNKLKAFAADGSRLWTSASLASSVSSYSPAPAISDMDGDGSPEIVIGRAILDADGGIVGEGDYGQGSNGVYTATSFATDVDGDGEQEVVVGNALYRMDGSAIWSNGQADGYVAVADFDGDGEGEIVVSGSATVRLQDGDGSVLWTSAIPRASGTYGGPPTVADFDGDGAPEIGVAANSTYTVFDTDGAMLWQQTTQDGSSGVTGSSVYDFEGDGVAEAVYADETRLWVFSGPDGAVKLESTEHSSWTVAEYPVIADVDGDGEAEIVVGRNMHPSYPSTARTGIAVFGDADNSWRPGRRIWNQHAYHITNVDDDGGVPRAPAANWDSYNNFRSGDVTAGSTWSYPDLTLATADVCALDCEDGALWIWVQPGNIGAESAPAGATVDVWGVVDGEDQWLASDVVGETLPSGWFGLSIQFVLDAVDPTRLERVWVEISPAEGECDPDNNVTGWEGPFCG